RPLPSSLFPYTTLFRSAVLLNERFARRGAYYVPAGSVDWDSLGPSYTPAGERQAHPDAWDPEDALFVPMRDGDGNLLGMISVDRSEEHTSELQSRSDLV